MLFAASAQVRKCDGFRMPARTNVAARTRAGVRKPPRKEGAGCGAPGSACAMEIWLTPSEHRGRHANSSPLADEHQHAFAAQGGIKFGVAKARTWLLTQGRL